MSDNWTGKVLRASHMCIGMAFLFPTGFPREYMGIPWEWEHKYAKNGNVKCAKFPSVIGRLDANFRFMLKTM